MSWMDSWSRPSKSTQFPPPIYLTAPDTPYCKSCGRVNSSRRNKQPSTTTNPNAPQIKYCSERCRRTKPGKVDQQIEDAFVALLKGDAESYNQKYPPAITGDQQEQGGNEKEKENETRKPKISKKGDARNIISCSEIETLVFGSRIDPSKTAGRRKNRVPRGVVETGEWKSVDMEGPPPGAHLSAFTTSNTLEDSYSDAESDSESDLGDVDISERVARYQSTVVDADYINFSAGKSRPSQSQSEVNGSVGGEKGWAENIEESPEMLEKRLEGQKRAKEREMVRRAARRGVVFGFVVEGDGDDREVVGRKKGAKEGGTKGKGRKSKDGKGMKVEGIEDDDGVRRRKCEAVITKAAVVVEPSYAKGDWGIRWREGVQ